MILGFLLLIGTGICWAGLAAVMAAGSVRQVPASKIQPYSALLVLLVCTLPGVIFGEALDFSRSWIQMICLLLAGSCNFFMLNLVQMGMKSGKNGVVWAFTQSSMMLPFMMGIICFGEKLTAFRLAGFLLIFFGLILFAKEKKGGGGGGKWLLPTVGAFLLSGIAQCFASLPSYFQVAGMSALRRMLLTQCGIILAYLITASLSRKVELPKLRAEKPVWILAGIFGGLNLAALLCFYRGLNLLADHGCASVGYPMGQGLGIALFFVAGCIKNIPGTLSLCGFFLITAGIASFVVNAFLN